MVDVADETLMDETLIFRSAPIEDMNPTGAQLAAAAVSSPSCRFPPRRNRRL
jgi:hypothetical protein